MTRIATSPLGKLTIAFMGIILLLIAISDSVDSVNSLKAKATQLWPLLATPWLGLILVATVMFCMWCATRSVTKAEEQSAEKIGRLNAEYLREREAAIDSVRVLLDPIDRRTHLLAEYVVSLETSRALETWYASASSALTHFRHSIPKEGDISNLLSSHFDGLWDSTWRTLNVPPPGLLALTENCTPVPPHQLPTIVRQGDGSGRFCAEQNPLFIDAMRAGAQDMEKRLRELDEQREAEKRRVEEFAEKFRGAG